MDYLKVFLVLAPQLIAGCLIYLLILKRDEVDAIELLSVGSVGDVAIWSLTGPAFSGAIADPIEAWLRCGPVAARDTIVHGKHVVRNHQVVSAKLETMLKSHSRLAHRMQKLANI